MNVVVFATEQDYTNLKKTTEYVINSKEQVVNWTYANDYDEFRKILSDANQNLMVVMIDGARGMEACIGARKIRPNMPLFWFSNDDGFGPQSYRLNCTYFGIKPVMEQSIKMAYMCYERQDV